MATSKSWPEKQEATFDRCGSSRKVDLKELEKKVNQVISRNLDVKKYVLTREEAEKVVNLWKVPKNIKKIRIIEIEGFDKRACKDDHVGNTSEIGRIRIMGVKRVGKDRYRFFSQ